MKRIITIILIITFNIVFLTGCWDRKDLNQLGIVMAIGLDLDQQSGKILLTSQVVRPSALGKQQRGKESPYDIVITSGDTVFEAIRNTTKEFDRRTFFPHVKVIVVDEAFARNGLHEIIDFISRTHELRKSTWLVVAKGSEAREVLSIKHGVESVQASYMEGIISSQRKDAEVSLSAVIDFLQKMQGGGINPVTGVFTIANVQSIPEQGKESEPRKGLVLTGTAVYKKDKLVGFLNNNETSGLNFLTGKTKSSTIDVPSLNNSNKNISIEVRQAKSSIKPRIINGSLSFTIKITVEGNITEVGDDTDVSDPVQLEKVNNKFKDIVKNSAEIAIAKIQKELKTDILGFGSSFEKKYPQDWKIIEGQWDSLFPKVSYNLSVKSTLRRTGLMLKPVSAKSGDK